MEQIEKAISTIDEIAESLLADKSLWVNPDEETHVVMVRALKDFWHNGKLHRTGEQWLMDSLSAAMQEYYKTVEIVETAITKPGKGIAKIC